MHQDTAVAFGDAQVRLFVVMCWAMHSTARPGAGAVRPATPEGRADLLSERRHHPARTKRGAPPAPPQSDARYRWFRAADRPLGGRLPPGLSPPVWQVLAAKDARH